MLTETLKNACIVEVEFILSEMERHALLAQSGAGFAERFGQDQAALFEWMAKIPHSARDREFVAGREALRRFHTIAKLVIDDRADAPDWDATVLAERLKITLLDFVFQQGSEDISTIVEPWIEAATRYVRSRHRRCMQYLPCVALQIGEQSSYSFGAIVFTQKTLFYDQLTQSMSRYDEARSRLSERTRRNAAPGLQWCWRDRSDSKGKSTEETFQDFTKGVDWIASIQVGRCDRSVSEARAEVALRIALSSMALLLQGTEGAGLRLAEDPSTPRHVTKLSSPGKGIVRPSSSWKFGTPATPDGWQEHLDAVAKPVLSIMHELIERTLAGSPLSFGYRIAMRAMAWYADAVRDTNVDTRLIKCATAVECLVLPDRSNARATFVIRGSLLAQRQNLPIAHCDRAPRVRALAQRLLCRLPGAAGDHPALRACMERIQRSETGLLRKRMVLSLELPATVKEHTVRNWIRETFAEVALDELGRSLGASELEIIEAAGKDQNLLLGLAIMATQDKRFDLLEEVVRKHFKDVWEQMSLSGPIDLSDWTPEERIQWAEILASPYGAKPPLLYAAWSWLHRSLKGPMPEGLMEGVVRSPSWLSELQQKEKCGPEWLEMLAACCPRPQRDRLRAQLADVDSPLTVTALPLMDILDTMEKA
jgi:hypothetical protein